MISTDDNYETKLNNLLKNVNEDYDVNQNQMKKTKADPTKEYDF